MATKDKQPDVEIYLRSDREEKEPAVSPPREEQFPIVLGDAEDFVSEQDTTVRQYEMNEFNGTSQDSLIEMNDQGEIESMVKPIIEGQEPVMRAKDESGIELNPTMQMMMDHFVDLSMKVEAAPTIPGQIKQSVSLPGQAIESAVGNSLRFFIDNTPEDFQNYFYDLGMDMERLGLVEKEGQPLGGLVGLTGSPEEFRERQFFSPEENKWWQDLGVSIMQYATGLKGVQMIANTKKLLVPSMAADGLVFDPGDGGLMTAFQALNLEPGAMQDVIDFMDSTQHDPNMGRAIQVAEGLLIGGILGTVGIAVQNREQVKSFIKKVFTPGSLGRQAADPAIKKVAELLTEVKAKWPSRKSFADYMSKHLGKAIGNERGAVGWPSEIEKITEDSRKLKYTARKTMDLVRLHDRIPEEERMVRPTPGQAKQPGKGGTYSELDLNKQGKGANFTQQDVEDFWQRAIDESENPEQLRELIKRLGLKPPSQKFLDKAFKLSNRARYWYEISSEKFGKELPDLTPNEMDQFIAIVSATSPNEKPFTNMKKAIAVFSQVLRNVPGEIGVMNKGGVARAIFESRLEGSKTGSFAGTFRYLLGRGEAPLSTNDVQVARMFGATEDVISQNSTLYEPISRFFNNVRDRMNKGIKAGDEPYESNQIQALGWVQQRIDATGDKVVDDYAAAIDEIKKILKVDKITREVLMDPKTATKLSSFQKRAHAPTATIEISTAKTPVQKEAENLYESLKAKVSADIGDKEAAKALRDYEVNVVQGLQRSVRGKDNPFEQAVEAITGKKSKTKTLTGMETPPIDEPYAVGGFYRDEAGSLTSRPNVRVPIPNLTPEQRKLFNAIIGRAWKQEAMASAQIKAVDVGAPVAKGAHRIYSIFVPTNEKLGKDDSVWAALHQELPDGIDIIFTKKFNGYKIDVLPNFSGGPNAEPEEIERAVSKVLSNYEATVSPSDYFSTQNVDFFNVKNAPRVINKFRKELEQDAIQKLQKILGSEREARRYLEGEELEVLKPKASVGNTRRSKEILLGYRGRIDSLSRAEQSAKQVSQDYRSAQSKWHKKYAPQYLAGAGMAGKGFWEPSPTYAEYSATSAVYDPDQEPEFQQAGWGGGGIKRALNKLFKPEPPPGRTVAPEQPQPKYGEATTLFRDAQPKDKPIEIEPDTAEFLGRQDDVDFTKIDLYGKHGRVNFGTIENTAQFGEGFRKWLVRTMELDDATPESITFDEIIEQAASLKWGAKDVMKLRPQDWDNSAPMLKVKDIWLQVAAHAYDITKRAAAGDPEVTEQIFKTAMSNFALVNKQKQALQASIARTLTAQRITRPGEAVESIEDFAQKLMTEANELPGNLSMQQMAKTILLAGDDASPEAWGDLAEEIPGMQEVFFAHFYPFMLSSFRTHAANWLSNGFVTTDYLATQGFAAMASPVRRKVLPNIPLLGRIFKDTADRKTAKEFLHTLQVMKQAIPEAFHVARKSYNAPVNVKMGKLERKQMPSEIVNAESMQKMFQNIHNNPAMKDKWFQRLILPRDLKQGGIMARAIDWWGKKLDYPGKLLRSADDFSKDLSKGMGELDHAYRKAGKLVEERIITEKESLEVVQQLLKDRPPRMVQAGETLAEFNTFQNDLGKIGEWIQEGREKVANFGWGIPWGHMILAFVKTPINVQKYNLHLVNLTKKSRDDIMGKNGGAKQDEALGRYAVASLYVTSASGLATNFFSDNVTLHGYGTMGAEIATEGKESQRAQRMVEMNVGIKPCSIGITDNKGTVHSYSFNTIEPLSTYFCATADIARNWHDLVADVGEGEAMKVMATLYEIGANNMINKNFARNFHEMMTVLFDPNQAIRSPKVADNFVTMVIPRIVKDINTSFTEDQHREFQHSMDGFMGMWEVMASNIPGLSRTLPGKVNYWNEPINNYGSWGPDFLSPFRYSKTTPDAVDKEMYRLLMPMRDLPRKLEGVKMHPQVRLRWYYLMNNYEGRGGVKMKQAIANLIAPSNDRYHEGIDRRYPGDPARADEDRIVLIKKTLNAYRGEAQKKLLDIANPDPIVMKYQPDLYDQIEAKKAQSKETMEALDPAKMDMRSERDWQDYYKNLQQQPSIGFE